jgi:hypothetical protein
MGAEPVASHKKVQHVALVQLRVDVPCARRVEATILREMNAGMLVVHGVETRVKYEPVFKGADEVATVVVRTSRVAAHML